MDANDLHASLYTFPGSKDHRRSRYGNRRRHLEDSFTCKVCHASVVALPMLSGVHNRNHCPYCLWSRHVDWLEAGDRMSACKAVMQPIGLTMKPTRNRYAHQRLAAEAAATQTGNAMRTTAGEPLKITAGEPLKVTAGEPLKVTAGELMLIHRCSDCGSLSINRIAADDTIDGLVSILQASMQLDLPTRQELEASHIHLLDGDDVQVVERQLFGVYQN